MGKSTRKSWMCQALKLFQTKNWMHVYANHQLPTATSFLSFQIGSWYALDSSVLFCVIFHRVLQQAQQTKRFKSSPCGQIFFSLAKPQRVQPRSQSLDRIISMRDKCVCICPNRRLWCRRRGRLMTFEEKWNLMGMPTHRHEAVLQELSPALPHHLVGNGWCFYNVVPALLVALAVAQGPVSWLT